tara:strand:- start:1771 stop:2451 length:681 start_codon:yes stop_codon:yes gene_type:complete
MRKHHNRLFYGKYKYKTAFGLKWAPMLYPTTDANLQGFIDGSHQNLRMYNKKIYRYNSDVVSLAKFIVKNRKNIKFRLQHNQAIFYTDKKLASELVTLFWQDWIGSDVINPKYSSIKENMVGCRRLPHGKYEYQIYLKKKFAWQINAEKRHALLKFLDTNVENTFVPNGLLIDWLEGKDQWYPQTYFYVKESKYLSPLYVIAGDMIEKVIQFKEIKNESNKKTTRK